MRNDDGVRSAFVRGEFITSRGDDPGDAVN